MSSLSASEGRTTPRKTATWRVRVVMPSGEVVEAKTIDISARGVGLLCPEPLELNKPVDLTLYPPAHPGASEQPVIPCHGKVVFQVPQGSDYRIGISE